MALERIRQMLALCSTDEPLFPPTDLYNEGWMLRLILDWFSIHQIPKHPLTISKTEKWYSEALLPSAFLPRYQGDQYAESWTHADGVIGNYKIGENGAGDLSLASDAKHLVVLEAKMFSKLSPGVTHARYYNQAARTVACMAEVLRRANRMPALFDRLSFFVIAPQQQIDSGVFKRQMTHHSIIETVQRRVDEYDESRDDWLKGWFLPTMEHITIGVMSWEELLGFVKGLDQKSGEKLNEFYALCLKFNNKSAKI